MIYRLPQHCSRLIYKFHFWGAEGGPILFSDLGFVWLHVRIYISVTKWRRSGFLEFTKLLLALSIARSSFAKPFDRMRSIQKHYLIILNIVKPGQDVLEKKQPEKEEVL